VTDNELDAVSDELVGDRDALLRVGHVVTKNDLDLFPVDAASSVDVRRSLLSALLQLCAESSVRTGHRTADADHHVSPGVAAEGHHGRQRNGGKKRLFHSYTPNL